MHDLDAGFFLAQTVDSHSLVLNRHVTAQREILAKMKNPFWCNKYELIQNAFEAKLEEIKRNMHCPIMYKLHMTDLYILCGLNEKLANGEPNIPVG